VFYYRLKLNIDDVYLLLKNAQFSSFF